MSRQDLQWWAGAIGAAILGAVAVVALPHPVDKYVLFLAGACGGFASYRITPPDSQKKELPHA